MANIAIQPGVMITIPQNAIAALPGGRVVRLLASVAIEFGFKEAGPFAALTGANTTGVDLPSGFIRCTTAAVDIVANNY